MRFRIPFLKQNRSQEDVEFIRFFVNRFGYRPKNIELFYQAVTHRSIAYHGQKDFSNERLEFLGDAILDSIIAEFLFQRFPEEDEGYLTKVKSKVVSRKTLSEIGEELELRSVLRYNKGRSINLSSLEGNAFEAIIGAIYLDSSYEATKKIIYNHIFRKYVDLNKILEEEIDFKSKLFIWSQKRRLSLEFVVLREENNHGTWFYEVIVQVNSTNYGKGTGNSKKLAEQAAAKETLILMGEI
ncbi:MULTISPECIES: ribonuclease III [Fluviicola]|uniref:ribonuclease III n=1 Tax=Fluviicola TaxID=332102 RepID=UPI0031378503